MAASRGVGPPSLQIPLLSAPAATAEAAARFDRRSSWVTSSRFWRFQIAQLNHTMTVDAGFERRDSALISPVLSEHHLRSRMPPADAFRIEGRRSSIDAPHERL